ncbi:hypothetical protein D3C76_1463060 [compost metagenome]
MLVVLAGLELVQVALAVAIPAGLASVFDQFVRISKRQGELLGKHPVLKVFAAIEHRFDSRGEQFLDVNSS